MKPNLWERIKAWSVSVDEADVKKQERAVISKYDHMIGEPVISFLESLRKTPHRYKLTQSVPRPDAYDWMVSRWFYQLTDIKTKDVYSVYIHDGELYTVIGLPFNLNHWELKAIDKGFRERYARASVRLRRMEAAKRTRERIAQDVAEKSARLEFAKRFQ